MKLCCTSKYISESQLWCLPFSVVVCVGWENFFWVFLLEGSLSCTSLGTSCMGLCHAHCTCLARLFGVGLLHRYPTGLFSKSLLAVVLITSLKDIGLLTDGDWEMKPIFYCSYVMLYKNHMSRLGKEILDKTHINDLKHRNEGRIHSIHFHFKN